MLKHISPIDEHNCRTYGIDKTIMNIIVIALGVFFGLSFLASLVVVAACALSSQTSQELEWSDHAEYYEEELEYEVEYDYYQESQPA